MRPAGLLLGVAADLLLGDPRRWHPVAGFGHGAAALERWCYADRRSAGVFHTAVLVVAAGGLGVAVERCGHRHPVLGTIGTAVGTWVVLGGTSLAQHGAALARELTSGELDAARSRMPSLCGRDPALLDAGGMARAGTESMAENTSDAVVAPLLWGAVAGVPGLLGYRAVNTLDAMVGYRSARYERFGWAAARLDDAVNLVPARVAGLLFAALAPVVHGSPAGALRAWRRDAAEHPSPNAGPVEAAVAGGLGVTLGGRTVYAHGIEERPRLGSGPPPTPLDLARAARLARWVSGAAGLLAAGVAMAIAQVPVGGIGRPGSGSFPAYALRSSERSAPRPPPGLRCSSSRRTK